MAILHRFYCIAQYDKCPKLSTTLIFLFSNEMFVIRVRIYKMPDRIANREDPVPTVSSGVICQTMCGVL